MKTLRLTWTALLLSAVTISQLPTPASCQMALRGIFSARCSMSCCNVKTPMPSCPMIKAEAPKDLIAASQPSFASALELLFRFGDYSQSKIQMTWQSVREIAQHARTLFRSPPPSVRAPPASVHLSNA